MKRILVAVPLIVASIALAGCDPYCKGDPNGSWECWAKGQPKAGGSSTSGAAPTFTTPSAPTARFCELAGAIACRNMVP